MEHVPDIIDLREMQPRIRHTIIFQLVENIRPGQGFQIVSDHEPKM